MNQKFPLNALGLSHRFIGEKVSRGGRCIDATCGRGRDTVYLATLVGEEGQVIALDIQEEAVNSTKALLQEKGLAAQCEVHLSCHSQIDRFAEQESVDAVVFNFGWLPGGDHRIFSRKETSCIAIEKALGLLKAGGVMSLCLYCGKENGYEEKNGILAFLKTLDPRRYSVLMTDFINRTQDPPQAVFILKEA